MDWLKIAILGFTVGVVVSSNKSPSIKQNIVSEESIIQIGNPLQFPYTVAISSASDACAGSILSSKYILTSATCIFPTRNEPSKMKVYTIGSKQALQVEGVKIHPAYRIYPEHNITGADIALIRLVLNMTIDGARVSAIKLPPRSYIRKPDASVGKQPLVASWSIQNLNSVLSYTEMKLMKQETCSKLWSKFGEFQLDKDLICTDKKFPCDLLGGSGLKIAGFAGEPMIIAVASGYDQCSTQNPTSVYTRVEPFVDWIKKIT